MLTKRENKEMHRMAAESFLQSGASFKKELQTVPPCRECGRVPAQYSRFSDGSVQCLDRAACAEHVENAA